MCYIPFTWRKTSKCKKLLRRLHCRLKFLKISRNSTVKQLQEDIVELLRNGKPETALAHAEELCQDQKLLTTYDLLEHFCEFIILHLPYIRKHKNYPNDINEAVSTLIFAAAWCGDLPELQAIRKLFKERHGSKFIKAITELHPGNHVNIQVKEKLCLKSIPENMKQSLIVELAKDHALQASNLLLTCGNDDLHCEGFVFEETTQGDNDILGQVVEIGNFVQVEDRYQSELVCNKLSGQASMETFGSNHLSANSFGNKVETRRTSSHSEFLVQINKITCRLDEVEEIHINTFKDHYAGDKTVFLFNSTLMSERNNCRFNGKGLLVKDGLWNQTTRLVDSCKRKDSNSLLLTGISPHSTIKYLNSELYYGELGNLSSYQKHIYHGTCPQDMNSRKIPSEYPLLGLSMAHSFKQDSPTEVWREISNNKPTEHSVGEFQNDILVQNSRKFGVAEASEFPECCVSTEHMLCPMSMIIAPERVNKTTNDYSLESESCNQFQNSKGNNSLTNRHVHPKLPDYDELVAKFKALKQEHQQKRSCML